MSKTALIPSTLIAAAVAAVSIPLVAQVMRSQGTHPEQVHPGTGAGVAAAQPSEPQAAAPIERVGDLTPVTPTAPPSTEVPHPTTRPTVVVALAAPPAPAAAPSVPATLPAVVAAAVLPATAAPEAVPPVEHATRPDGPASLPTTVASTGPAAATNPASAPATTGPSTRPTAPPAVIRDAAGKAIDPDKVVITVGSEKLTAGDVDAFISDLPADQQAVVRSEGRRGLADYLVKTELLAQEAKTRKLNDDPHVQRQMRLVQDQVLARALIGDVRDGVDDATIRKYFDEHRNLLERVHARHILIRTPGSKVQLKPGQKELTEEQAKAKATDVYNRLKAGADFAKIAREESDDTGSGAGGGDLGSVNRGRTVEPFEKAAFALKEGEIGQPVRSPFGWHVIQVVERFDTPDKLAEQIRTAVGPTKTQDLIQELEQSHKADVDDGFFGPPEPPDAGAPKPATTAPTTTTPGAHP